MTARRSSLARRLVFAAVAVLVVVVGAVGIADRRSTSSPSAIATNPNLDPGTSLSRPAPDFTLTDQFGIPVSLHSFRGRVVILAFNDSECTTICPLTTSAMLAARRMLGAAANQVQLLGVDANPTATAVSTVRRYSELHGMMRQWHFATGSLPQLKAVWRAYHIDVAIQNGQIDHTPALFVIDPRGRLAKLYMTQQAYAAVGQLGQLLAHEASSLLAGHPHVDSSLSYAHIPGVSPAATVKLPGPNGGTVTLGPGAAPRLFLFFATWDAEVTDLAAHLEALNAYHGAAAAAGLPSLTAVDEASVEPSSNAVRGLLGSLRRPLSYPVALDQSGRVADGYGVQDAPWLVLVSARGEPLWYYDIATQGWLSQASLAARMRAALRRVPEAPAGAAAVAHQLAGSPQPLATLHQQAGQLLGAGPALPARIRALRGYPVVINAWASWCGPCRTEFSLFASASARFGRQVAFLGADSDDSAGDARAFLAQHPVSYPSFQTRITQLGSLAQIVGLPTTIFLDRAGKVVHVQTGQYESQGALDGDVSAYGLSH